MRTCEMCKEQIHDDALWCESCGRKVVWGRYESPKEKVEEPSDVQSEVEVEPVDIDVDERDENSLKKAILKKMFLRIVAVIAVGLIILFVGIGIFNEISKKKSEINFQELKVGDVIDFGYVSAAYLRYSSQDSKLASYYSDEQISWVVLDIQDGRALLITEDVIETNAYGLRTDDVLWSSSLIRSQLNNSFYEDNFDEAERERILLTTLNCDGGANDFTQDYIFLLSTDEVASYFRTDKLRISNYTSHGYTSHCMWWLRSPGTSENRVSIVNMDGSINYIGCPVQSFNVGVRPAMWINIES